MKKIKELFDVVEKRDSKQTIFFTNL